MENKKLLVFTSTFPRWKDDPKPSFIYDLSMRLTKQFNVFVLSPHFPGAKIHEQFDNLQVFRFKYFITRFQTLTDIGGILSALSHNKLNYMLIPFLIMAELWNLMKFSIRLKPDLIHAHWLIPQGFISYLNYKLLKIPYIITVHGSDAVKLERLSFLKKLSLSKAKKITAVSDELKRIILNKIDSRLNIEVIPMGVDTRIFKPRAKKRSILEKYNINYPFLLFVGRIAPEKGIEYLIEAMPTILKQYSETKLLIIGSGNHRKQLEDLSNKKRLQESVIFVDPISNKELPAYYATADVFVSPSLSEGSPVTYIEALACGTSIVVGDLPVSREMAGEGRGKVVKQNDPDSIAQNILILLKKNIYKKDLHEFVKYKYDWEVITNQFTEVLNP